MPPALAANFFQFTFSGPEIQMLAGLLDIRKMVELGTKGGGGKIRVQPEITHRIFMSPRGFMILRQQVNEIFDKMQEQEVFKVVDE